MKSVKESPPSTVAETFWMLEQRLNNEEFKQRIGAINTIYHFPIQGWFIIAMPEIVGVYEGTPEMLPNCIVTISDENFMKLVNGASAKWMYIRGKLKVTDRGLAMRLGELFK